MADNIVQRIIKLILDKESADKTQKDIEGVGAKVEKTWKDTAARIAGYLGVAFLTKKVIDFGREAVKQASDAQATWAQLKGTIDGTGVSFDKLEERIRATADAFQDATIHDDDAFAESLTRMVTLTGDVNASLNNMGLVANVAAQFFKGDLGPATDLVSKAMNGNIAALNKMGIHVKTAQEALEVLAHRSMGAASREAQSFGGQVKQLGNAWDDALKLLGEAIIKSDGASSALTVLRNVVERLTSWIDDNQDAISKWVTNGVNFAIDAADVFIRAVDGMGRILVGGFLTSLGLTATGIGRFIGFLGMAQEKLNPDWWKKTSDVVRKAMGMDPTDQEAVRAGTILMKNQANALDEWGASITALGTSQVAKGIDVLSTPLFSSKDFQGTARKPRATPGEENKPLAAGGTLTPEQENIQKAMEEFEKAGLRISVMEKALGKDFDGIGAEIDRTTKLLQALAENAGDTSDIENLQKWLRTLTLTTDPLIQSLAELNQQLDQDLTIAALDGADALESLQIEQKSLEAQIRKVMSAGAGHETELKRLKDRYKDVTGAIKEQTAAMEVQAEAADFLADALGTALQGGLAEAASKKAKQNAIEAAEMLVRAGAFALFGDFPHAAGALKLAASFGALALAWGALAAGSRGGGGGAPATTSTPAGAGSSGGEDVTNARRSSSRASSSSQQVGSEVSVYLVGPGFDALNPAVQRVVWGASQQAAERYGPNARVRVVPRGE